MVRSGKKIASNGNNINGDNPNMIGQNLQLYNSNSNDFNNNLNDISNGNSNNIVITCLEVQLNKKLKLVETEGNILDGRKIYINASGMVDGLRNKRDGSTLFGRLKYNNNRVRIILIKNHINDFILNMNQINESVNTVFKIQFDRGIISLTYQFNKDLQQYYLTNETTKDESLVLFVHLDNKFVIFIVLYQ